MQLPNSIKRTQAYDLIPKTALSHCLKGLEGEQEHSRMEKPWDGTGKVTPVTVSSQYPPVQYFWDYTNTNPSRDNVAVKTRGNNLHVCPHLHFPPGKKPTKINYCITFYFNTAPEQNLLNTKLLSCHHYFETAIHTFSPLAFTSLTISSINAIS